MRAPFAALVVALVATVAPAASAAPKTFPASGQLVWPSVAVRKAPAPTAARKMTLFDLRSDLRPQIVLAIGQRRVGFLAGTYAQTTLTNTAGAPALAVRARDEGDDGNGYHVAVQDSRNGLADWDDFVIFDGSGELMRIPFHAVNVSGVAVALNGSSAPVRATALAPDGTPLSPGGASLAGGRDGKPGTLWYRLNLPIRPFGQTGWVPAESVSVASTKKRIVVRRGSRTLEVFQGARRIFRARVAVGRPDRKTPLGNFYVAAKYVPPQNAMVSGYALELSAPAGLPDFLKGGVVGIHGTPATWSIGRSASNGCVRVTNATVFRLRQIVPLGTPVKVVR